MPFGTTLQYQGYTLKSKIEFFWARHFLTQGFDWEYEPVRFRDKKESYTPDFGLNQNAFFIETKVYGAKGLKNRFYLCSAPLLLIFGTPDRHYIHFKPANARAFLPGHMTWPRAYQKVST